jgi:Domain of unknown function (DUF4864)
MRSLRAERHSMSARALRHRRWSWLAARMLGLAAFFALEMTAAIAAEPEMRASDWKAIEQVISAQRAALVAGDGDKAFSYATPAIRAQFGDTDTFMVMVRVAYPALVTARYTEFMEGAVISGLVIQPLRLIDPDNTVRVALYTLEKQEDGAWRISGCRISPSTVQAAQLRRWLLLQSRPAGPQALAMRSNASSKRLA